MTSKLCTKWNAKEIVQRVPLAMFLKGLEKPHKFQKGKHLAKCRRTQIPSDRLEAR